MAIKAGVASIEHGSLIDAEGIQMMKERGIYLSAGYGASMTPRNEHFLEQPLPSSEDAERMIIANILIDNTLMEQTVERLDAADLLLF